MHYSDLQELVEEQDQLRTIVRSTVHSKPEKLILIARSRTSLLLRTVSEKLWTVAHNLHEPDEFDSFFAEEPNVSLPETLLIDQDLPPTVITPIRCVADSVGDGHP